ncbi:MAG: dUTP diphosphatase [Candidatus Pacearchaeota archaeon]
MQEVTVKIKKIHQDAKIPSYAHPGEDAGMDVFAVGKEIKEKYIEYKTGLAFEVPKGYACFIFPRSSVTNKDLMLKNSVGVLDSGYRGELILRFQKFAGQEIYEAGDRIGQIIILPYPFVKIEETNELEESNRGSGGFGHTGK